MRVVSSVLLAAVFASVACALPTPADDDFPGLVCGKNDYTEQQIKAAANTACQRLKADSPVGDNKYPHEFRDEEGFGFDGVEGPYYEFPLRPNGIYKGGSPGADRVIINSDCDFAGLITHTGAKGNDFVECED